jgi:hypothetical protein
MPESPKTQESAAFCSSFEAELDSIFPAPPPCTGGQEHDFDVPQVRPHSYNSHLIHRQGEVVLTEMRRRTCKRCGAEDVQFRDYTLAVGEWRSRGY